MPIKDLCDDDLAQISTPKNERLFSILGILLCLFNEAQINTNISNFALIRLRCFGMRSNSKHVTSDKLMGCLYHVSKHSHAMHELTKHVPTSLLQVPMTEA